MTLLAVSASEPAGTAVVDYQKLSVCLLVHRGGQNDALVQSMIDTAHNDRTIIASGGED